MPSGQGVCKSAKNQQRFDSKQWLDQLVLLSLPGIEALIMRHQLLSRHIRLVCCTVSWRWPGLQQSISWLCMSGDCHWLLLLPSRLLLVLLQEAGIRAYQSQLLAAWDRHRPVIEAVDNSLTLQELRHAAGLVRGASGHLVSLQQQLAACCMMQ
jgi:hypothetical protein